MRGDYSRNSLPGDTLEMLQEGFDIKDSGKRTVRSSRDGSEEEVDRMMLEGQK